jgi:hypothetical protein
LTAALCLDLKRDEAARFSFLLGLPAIALAGLKELWTLHQAGLSPYGWSILVFVEKRNGPRVEVLRPLRLGRPSTGTVALSFA